MVNKFYRDEVALAYDDVLLVPTLSSVSSRRDVDLSVSLSHEVNLSYPIMSAAMDTITGKEMSRKLASLGCLGVVHRFQSIEKRLECKVMGGAVAVGLKDSLEDCINLAEEFDILAVDIAHAHHMDVLEFVYKLQCNIKASTSIMVGNIATGEAALDLAEAGADIVKVGIGSGAACSTRMVTGFGYPNVSAILEVKRTLDNFGPFIKIVADGGVRSSSDFAKALAAGADCVMVGSMFAGTDETPGQVVEKMKVYRGMASNDAQIDFKGKLTDGTIAEGVSSLIPCKGPVENVVNDIVGGLRSALTYAGAHDLEQFYSNTKFIRITAAGVQESIPHIFNKVGVLKS